MNQWPKRWKIWIKKRRNGKGPPTLSIILHLRSRTGSCAQTKILLFFYSSSLLTFATPYISITCRCSTRVVKLASYLRQRQSNPTYPFLWQVAFQHSCNGHSAPPSFVMAILQQCLLICLKVKHLHSHLQYPTLSPKIICTPHHHAMHDPPSFDISTPHSFYLSSRLFFNRSEAIFMTFMTYP